MGADIAGRGSVSFDHPDGGESEHQKALAGDSRFDFVGWRGYKPAAGDAKDKVTVTSQNVDKLIEYTGVFKARTLLLIVACDTQMSADLRKHAELNGVEIVQARWRT